MLSQKDKQYDVFVALRVFHHFRTDFVVKSFNEWLRIADHVILAMPKTFDMSIIKQKPTKIIVCNAKTNIYYYEQTK